ncbi:unnamed protein product [Closterium sp. Naga37s-1]|nr:unnamed protein product [Closterium sp. Naga37s-1]
MQKTRDIPEDQRRQHEERILEAERGEMVGGRRGERVLVDTGVKLGLSAPPLNSGPSMAVVNMSFYRWESVAPPPVVDWRKTVAITPIQTQYVCSSCWAIAAVDTIAIMWAIANNGVGTNLSPQQVCDCATKQCCQGGWPEWAFSYVLFNGGVTSNANYPYLAYDSATCLLDTSMPSVAQITGWELVPAFNAMALMKAVSMQPVVAFISASAADFTSFRFAAFPYSQCFPTPSVTPLGHGFPAFPSLSSTSLHVQAYSSNGVLNIYNGVCTTDVNHAVVVVGFNYTGPDLKGSYWIIKNSWYSTWGDRGFMYLAMTPDVRGKCGILSTPAMYPVYFPSGQQPARFASDKRGKWKINKVDDLSSSLFSSTLSLSTTTTTTTTSGTATIAAITDPTLSTSSSLRGVLSVRVSKVYRPTSAHSLLLPVVHTRSPSVPHTHFPPSLTLPRETEHAPSPLVSFAQSPLSRTLCSVADYKFLPVAHAGAPRPVTHTPFRHPRALRRLPRPTRTPFRWPRSRPSRRPRSLPSHRLRAIDPSPTLNHFPRPRSLPSRRPHSLPFLRLRAILTSHNLTPARGTRPIPSRRTLPPAPGALFQSPPAVHAHSIPALHDDSPSAAHAHSLPPRQSPPSHMLTPLRRPRPLPLVAFTPPRRARSFPIRRPRSLPVRRTLSLPSVAHAHCPYVVHSHSLPSPTLTSLPSPLLIPLRIPRSLPLRHPRSLPPSRVRPHPSPTLTPVPSHTHAPSPRPRRHASPHSAPPHSPPHPIPPHPILRLTPFRPTPFSASPHSAPPHSPPHPIPPHPILRLTPFRPTPFSASPHSAPPHSPLHPIPPHPILRLTPFRPTPFSASPHSAPPHSPPHPIPPHPILRLTPFRPTPFSIPSSSKPIPPRLSPSLLSQSVLSPSVLTPISTSPHLDLTPSRPHPISASPHLLLTPSPPHPISSSPHLLHTPSPPHPISSSSHLRLTPSPPHPISSSPHLLLTPSPPHPISASPHLLLTPSPPHPISASPHRLLTPSPPHPISASPHLRLTPSPPHPISSSPHLLLTPSPPHPISSTPHLLLIPSPPHPISTSPHLLLTPSPPHPISSTPHLRLTPSFQDRSPPSPMCTPLERARLIPARPITSPHPALSYPLAPPCPIPSPRLVLSPHPALSYPLTPPCPIPSPRPVLSPHPALSYPLTPHHPRQA